MLFEMAELFEALVTDIYADLIVLLCNFAAHIVMVIVVVQELTHTVL